MLFALILVALAGYVSAQLSAGCKTALLAISTNPDAAACLTPTALIPAFSGQNTTLLSTIDTWVTNMCAATPCSNATIAAVAKNVTTGCASDVSSALLENIHSAQYVYSTVRKIMCLKDSGKNCLTQTLANVQAFMGGNGHKPLTNLSDSNFGAFIASAGSFVGTLEANVRPSSPKTRSLRFGARSANQTQTISTPKTNSSLPANITTCTPCIKSAAQIINNDFPGSVDNMFPGLAELCGIQVTNNTNLGVSKAVGIHSSATGLNALLSGGTYFGAIMTALVMTISAVSLG